mgnify:CR=1 FL=1
MFKKKTAEASFYDVALALIIMGALILTYGLVGWLFNSFGSACTFVFPSMKIMGGLVILALGYIQLELELLRKR